MKQQSKPIKAKPQAPDESSSFPWLGIDVREGVLLEIMKVADLLTRVGASDLFSDGLSQAQFNILMILKRHGKRGMSQKDIGETLVSTKGNVSIHIGNLTRMGHVRRKTSQEDRRKQVVTLTAKGQRVLAALEPRYLEQIEVLTRPFSGDQLEAAAGFLATMQAHCEAVLSGAVDTPADD